LNETLILKVVCNKQLFDYLVISSDRQVLFNSKWKLHVYNSSNCSLEGANLTLTDKPKRSWLANASICTDMFTELQQANTCFFSCRIRKIKAHSSVTALLYGRRVQVLSKSLYSPTLTVSLTQGFNVSHHILHCSINVHCFWHSSLSSRVSYLQKFFITVKRK
jgi:hypothetical protein